MATTMILSVIFMFGTITLLIVAAIAWATVENMTFTVPPTTTLHMQPIETGDYPPMDESA